MVDEMHGLIQRAAREEYRRIYRAAGGTSLKHSLIIQHGVPPLLPLLRQTLKVIETFRV